MTLLEELPRGSSRERSIPVLETKRLVLRAPRLEDAKAVAVLANDRRIAENTARIPHPYKLTDAETFIANVNGSEGEAVFLVTQRDGTVMGACGVSIGDEQPPELGYWLGVPHWGKGYATEALHAVIDYAFGAFDHAALHAGTSVGIFSLEMSKPQIVLRMLSSEARVDSHALRTGKLQKEDWWRLAEAAGRLEQAPIYIDDTGGITVQQMRGKARRLKAERGLDLLIVDYLQLMQGRSDAESRQQEISDISRSLKALAKELNVPVVALSQLSRAVEARKPPIPMLADLRESGAIEQDADVVMFIYREDVYDQNSERKGIADILVSKHRNGPIGKKELFFHDRYAKFESLDNREVV